MNTLLGAIGAIALAWIDTDPLAFVGKLVIAWLAFGLLWIRQRNSQ